MTDVLDHPVVKDPQLDLPPAGQGRSRAADSTLPLRWFLAATLLGAGAVHLAVAPPHFGESTLLGAGFVASAWMQVALAVAVVVRPTRCVLLVTVVASVVFIAVWALSRTAGLPLGGEAGQPEAVAFVDGVCIALEAITTVVATALIARPTMRVTFRVPALIAVFGALAVTTAAIASPSARDHADHAAAGGTATTGGAVELNGQHLHGVKAQDVATETQPDQPLDAATRAVLAQQLVEARAVAMRYPTASDAAAAGYRLAGGFAPGSGAHFISYSGLTGPGPFDPGRPLALIYSGTSPTSPVIGLMYYAVGSSPPEGFAGPNDHWHRHSNVCIKFGQGGVQVPLPVDADVTAAQSAGVHGYLMTVTGWMVHAWVVPSWESPLGVFSHDNPDVRCADGTYKTNRAGFCQGT